MTVVDPSSTTHLSAPVRHFPVIVVPGIMGTRLAEPGPGHRMVWNPMGAPLGDGPGLLATDAARLMNVGAPLAPDEWTTSGYDPDKAARAAFIPNFYNLIPDFYADLCFALNETLADRVRDRGLKPRVYACGYDWRRSNKIAAQRLQRVVHDAMEECNGEQAILVAHSMGGLVCRYYCRVFGGQRRVRALILLGSPSIGAVQPYALLKRGILPSDDLEMYGLRRVFMGLGTNGSRDFLRALPSMYQLLPNQVYGHKEHHWLDFDADETGYPFTPASGAEGTRTPLADCTAGYDIYRDMFAGFTERAATRTTYLGNIDEAEGFHRPLTRGTRAYMHPDTHAIHCTDLGTASNVRLRAYGRVEANGGTNEYIPHMSVGEMMTSALRSRAGDPEVRLDIGSGHGDSKVPTVSGCPTPGMLTSPIRTQDRPSGVAHGALPSDPGVITKVITRITEIQF